MKNEKLARKYATVAWRLEKALPDWITNCEKMNQIASQSGQSEMTPLVVQIEAYKSIQKFMKRVADEFDKEGT